LTKNLHFVDIFGPFLKIFITDSLGGLFFIKKLKTQSTGRETEKKSRGKELKKQ